MVATAAPGGADAPASEPRQSRPPSSNPHSTQATTALARPAAVTGTWTTSSTAAPGGSAKEKDRQGGVTGLERGAQSPGSRRPPACGPPSAPPGPHPPEQGDPVRCASSGLTSRPAARAGSAWTDASRKRRLRAAGTKRALWASATTTPAARAAARAGSTPPPRPQSEMRPANTTTLDGGGLVGAPGRRAVGAAWRTARRDASGGAGGRGRGEAPRSSPRPPPLHPPSAASRAAAAR